MSECPICHGPCMEEHGEAPCTCARIKVGMTVTESRNWNPDCAEHGVDSAWWKSPAQKAKRAADSERLRALQAQAREARRAAR